MLVLFCLSLCFSHFSCLFLVLTLGLSRVQNPHMNMNMNININTQHTVAVAVAVAVTCCLSPPPPCKHPILSLLFLLSDLPSLPKTKGQIFVNPSFWVPEARDSLPLPRLSMHKQMQKITYHLFIHPSKADSSWPSLSSCFLFLPIQVFACFNASQKSGSLSRWLSRSLH